METSAISATKTFVSLWTINLLKGDTKLKRATLAVALLLAASGLTAQSSSPTPELSQELQLKITRIQNDQLAAQVEANQLQARLTQLSSQFTDDAKQLVDLQAQAFREAKLSPEAYDLDPKTLKFTPKPAPAAKTPAAK